MRAPLRAAIRPPWCICCRARESRARLVPPTKAAMLHVESGYRGPTTRRVRTVGSCASCAHCAVVHVHVLAKRTASCVSIWIVAGDFCAQRISAIFQRLRPRYTHTTSRTESTVWCRGDLSPER